MRPSEINFEVHNGVPSVHIGYIVIPECDRCINAMQLLARNASKYNLVLRSVPLRTTRLHVIRFSKYTDIVRTLGGNRLYRLRVLDYCLTNKIPLPYRRVIVENQIPDTLHLFY